MKHVTLIFRFFDARCGTYFFIKTSSLGTLRNDLAYPSTSSIYPITRFTLISPTFRFNWHSPIIKSTSYIWSNGIFACPTDWSTCEPLVRNKHAIKMAFHRTVFWTSSITMNILWYLNFRWQIEKYWCI